MDISWYPHTEISTITYIIRVVSMKVVAWVESGSSLLDLTSAMTSEHTSIQSLHHMSLAGFREREKITYRTKLPAVFGRNLTYVCATVRESWRSS